MKNWLNMHSHPTDSYAFWRTKQPELEQVRAKFDLLIDAAVRGGIDREQAIQMLGDLMSWAASERECDVEYNRSDC